MNGKIMIPALLALLLAACGGGLSGTFEDEMGMSAYTFHGGGRVGQSSPLVGVEREMKYELVVDNDRKRVVKGKRVSVRGVLGGRRLLKKKKQLNTHEEH